MSKEEIILKIINKKIRYVTDGYSIIDQIADGCDEYGYKYWVECKNGYHARSWDVEYEKRRSLKNLSDDVYSNGIRFSVIEGGIKTPKRSYFIKDISSVIYNLQLSHIKIIDDEEYNFRYIEKEQVDLIIDVLEKIFCKYCNISYNDIKLCKTFDEIKSLGLKNLGIKHYSIAVCNSHVTKYHKKMLLDKPQYARYLILKRWRFSKFNPKTLICQNILSNKINNLLNT